jgi:hypothetical protein
VFNTTFNNISVILLRSALLVEETRVPVENHWPVASPWQTLSHNVISSTHTCYYNLNTNCDWKVWIKFSDWIYMYKKKRITRSVHQDMVDWIVWQWFSYVQSNLPMQSPVLKPLKATFFLSYHRILHMNWTSFKRSPVL